MQTCIRCREGAPTLTQAEPEALRPQRPGWTLVEQHRLQRSLRFPAVQRALGRDHAEAVIDTHKVDGVTQADAVLAAKFNTIGSGSG